MFPTPPKGDALFVEPLEARIAPTGLVGLANDPNDPNVTGDVRYVAYNTAPATGKLGFVPASTYGVAGSNVYALKLSGDGSVNSAGHPNGDELVIFNSATGFNLNNPFLQAVNGNVIAFFQDKNGDGQVQTNELVGISMGKNASIDVVGNVNGDIVTNLSKDGSTISLTSAGKANTSVGSVNIQGNVFGSILSGGNINNVTVSGTVVDVHAGTAVNGAAYHLGDPSLVTGTLTAPAMKDGRVGASINMVSVLSVSDIHAGDGGLGAAGGSVSAVTLQSDTAGFNILSGQGGIGNATVHAGAGGDISDVVIKGVIDNTPNNLIMIHAGDGGADPLLKGGAGGSVSGVATSFDSFDPTTGAQQVSSVFLADNIIVQAGNGGMGLRGGTGGSVSNSLIYGAIPDDGVTNADGTANAEIQVLGGQGGTAASTTSGHGGNGGAVSQVTAENVNAAAAALTSSILIHGGDAGAGKQGGDLEGITVLGAHLNLLSGNGGNGLATGGAAGEINTVHVLAQGGIFASDLVLDAGTGGAASAGAGGAGGDIAMVTVDDSNIAVLAINDGTHANGGTGSNGLGGAGGSVTGVQITDSGPFLANAASANVRAGTGGDGFTGGGAGGAIGTLQLLGTDFAYNVAAGAGGNVLANGRGRGGDGGELNTVGISNQSFSDVDPQFTIGGTGTASGGAGGNGTRGGVGGDVVSADLRATDEVTLLGGAGGIGTTRKAGAGGGISTSAGSSLLRSVAATAGSAGQGGAKPAAGGTIDAFIAAAATDILMTSGAGAAGGAGGDITNSGTTLNELTQLANTGSVLITAGAGSSGNGIAGAGGSISSFNGSIGQGGRTALTAGAGGGGSNATASGAGGSVSTVTLTGTADNGASTTVVTFDAGDAGQGGQAKTGAAGGNITGITLGELAAGTVVQHFAAGDGGSALKRGGAGGTISQVNVGAPGDAVADIGIRSGVAYGYNVGTGAGGLFSGVGGTGVKSNGVNGDVTTITASAIASIAAGKGATPQLAGTVDGIALEGEVVPVADATGAFTNFGTANLVGSVINPTAAGASTYQTGDGLIAATHLTVNRNFFPEAELTLDSSGNLELVDLQEPSPVPVVTPAG